MHNGNLKEMASPFDLLSRAESEFKSLAEQSNEFDDIYAIAKSKAEMGVQ